MKLNISSWSVNQKLAFVAFALGFIAIFMRDPSKAHLATVDTAELALKVQDGSANVSPETLAGWLIEKKADFALIDLRNPSKFREYNIPTSVNIIPADLAGMDLPKTQKILLYSDDNLQAAQAWFLLRSKNFKAVYMLSGGINEWKDKVLFPGISDNATPEEKAKFEKMAAISRYFGGSPRVASGSDSSAKPQVAMPRMPAPVAGSAPAGGGGKPKREGC